MSIIHVLSAEMAGRIAAGEVIERPASVVKELVENSIDAGATRIRVQIEQGGHRLIQVTDNGCGMDRGDALMCLEAHATSKLTTDGDVGQIRTLGFRGEAIPSIASVSRFQLQTRRKDDDVGTEVIVDNGIINNVSDCGCAPGTNIKVGYLFGNLPVRRKFMKGADTEEGYIEEMILMLALTRPDISFTLTFNGRDVIKTTSTTDLSVRVMMLLGRDAFESMLPVDYEESGIRVRGFVSKPGYTRSSRREQRMIINGRAASAETLFFAIREAYDTLIMKGRYPGTILYVDMPPEKVDVNVHPAKREVRFSDARLVGGVVAAAIRRALRQMPGAGLDHSVITSAGTFTPVPFTAPMRQKELVFDEGEGAGEEEMAVGKLTESPVPPVPSVAAQPPVPPAPSVSSVPPARSSVLESRGGAEKQVPVSPVVSVTPSKSVPLPTGGSGQLKVSEVSEGRPQEPVAESGKFRESSVPKSVPVAPSLPSVQPSIPSLTPIADAKIAAPAGGVPIPSPLPAPSSGSSSSPVPRQSLKMAICGRLGKRYVLAEGSDGLIIVDIRAAHQRIVFEQLLMNLKRQSIPRQQLLLPVTVNLSNEESRFLKSQLKQFDEIGFSVEPFGGNTYIITAVPANYPNEDLGKTLRDILEDLRQNRSVNSLNPIHLAQMACRHAIGLKENLSDAEIRQILEDLSKAEMPYADPAGNPTMIHVTYGELEKRFKN